MADAAAGSGAARQFSTWLTKREGSAGRLPMSYRYTLPTDAGELSPCPAAGVM